MRRPVRRGHCVASWELGELLDHILEIAVILQSDVIYGESRAVGELAARFELCMAEILERISSDAWAPRAA